MRRLLRYTSSGKVELVTGLFMIIFLVIISGVQMQMSLFYYTSRYMEDALAASNLASAVADIGEYGKTHNLLIAYPERAYELYREAVRLNLQLNEEWASSRKEIITGKVEVLQYIVYNVKDQDIFIYCFGKEGNTVREEKGGLGSVRTPDGTLVESTTVYSRIGFPVEGIFGIKVYAEKDKSVDIISAVG